MKEQNGFKSSLTDLIDDATYARFDKRKCALYYDQYLGKGQRAKMKRKAREDTVAGIKQNKPRGILHSWVRAVIKKTPLFNRLFVAADKFFGYGKPMDPEKWWNLDLPTYGIDTRR